MNSTARRLIDPFPLMALLAFTWSCGGTGSESGPAPAEPVAPSLDPQAAALDDEGVPAAGEGEADGGSGELPHRLGCLVRSYGEFISEVDRSDQATGPVIVMNGGLRIPWHDGASKNFEEKLSGADLEDQMSIPYPVGESKGAPAVDDDPGRIRVGEFLEAVYGSSAAQVRQHLVDVDWMRAGGGGKVRFNALNGAAEALGRVSKQLESLPRDLYKYAVPSAGTFNWRKIAGTRRPSTHSFGIAIDLNTRYSSYWRWALGRSSTPVYHNRIPYEIVEVFERNGFVWGGKWYHYDTMHFEYRPELLDRACVR